MTEKAGSLERIEREMISGWLHRPQGAARSQGLVITHGAGSNCNSPLVIAVAGEFAADGIRCCAAIFPIDS